MKTGPIYPQGNVNYDTWEKIYEHEISASDTEAQLLYTMQGPDANTYWTADTGQTATSAGTATIDDAQAKIGNASLLLDGNSDYVTFPDSTDWDILNVTDCTVEAWVRFTDYTAEQCIYSQWVDGSNYWQLRTSGSALQFFYSKAGVTGNCTGGAVSANGTWYHLALVKEGSNWGTYVNGVQGGYLSDATTHTLAAVLNIGRKGDASQYLGGHTDGVRISHSNIFSVTPDSGLTSSFTPPTTIDDYVGTSAITIFGLEGDTDEQYLLDWNGVDDTTVGFHQLRFNGYAGNYGRQDLKGADTTISAFRGTRTFINIGFTNVDGNVSQSQVLIHAKSGFDRTVLVGNLEQCTGTTVNAVYANGNSWDNTTDELTSMTINAPADSFAIGTVVSLYRRITA